MVWFRPGSSTLQDTVQLYCSRYCQLYLDYSGSKIKEQGAREQEDVQKLMPIKQLKNSF
ncbi:MAG: hypothetical protein ACI8RD_003269 [Bacillariaceae sp.]|jgi:hypothetical protein